MNKLPNLPINHQTVKPYTFVPVLRIFTTVESALQISSFMQNKANFQKSQMNITSVKTMNYEQITMNNDNKNKPNTNPIQTQSNPIKANKMPKQTQSNPIQPPFLPQKSMLPPKNNLKKPYFSLNHDIFSPNSVKGNASTGG